jgi:hypothetical protein
VGLRNAGVSESGSGVEFDISDPNIAQASNTFSMKVKQAFLYWNIIQKNDGSLYGTSIDFREETDSYTTFAGEAIGCCGNTCWSAFGPAEVDPDPGSELINFVYRADVTSAISTATAMYLAHMDKTYTVKGFPISSSTASFDGTKYPGIHATQGAVLVIIFEWVDGPSTQGFPREKDFWKIRIYDGAKLISSEGDNHHQITHPAICLGCPNFVFSAGDSQRAWRDMVFVNGIRGVDLPPHPQNSPPAPGATLGATRPQVFYENVGEGLGIQLYVAPIPDSTITIDVTTDSDCLVWFLYIHAAHCCNCRVKVRLTATGAGLNVAGTKTVSLGEQYVDAVVVIDTCDCLDDDNPVLIKVNSESSFSNIPSGGRLVQINDLIDIKLNTTKCGICEQWGPYCAVSSSSGGGPFGSKQPGAG